MANKHLRHIFLWPTVIAILTAAGLITALLFDDMREWASNTAIALPAVVTLYFYWLKPRG